MVSKSQEARDRIDWIDALKGFGIFCVTFGHLAPWYPLETHIYSFHMFMFFFISGYLFKKRPLSILVPKKIKNILVPFLIWNFLASLMAIMLGDGISETISKFFIINGQLCWDAPIWFLLILFMAEIVYDVAMLIGKPKKMIPAILLMSVVLWIIIGGYALPLKLNLLPLAVFFYGLGNISRVYIDKYLSSKVTPPRYCRAAALLLGVVSILFGTILNSRISYTGGTFGNIYYCIIAAIAGTLFYVWIFRNFKILGKNKLLRFLGKNSLIIMVTQYWLFRGFDFISQKAFGISAWHYRNTIKALIIAIITISIILLIVTLLKKVFRNKKKAWNLLKYIGIQ